MIITGKSFKSPNSIDYSATVWLFDAFRRVLIWNFWDTKAGCRTSKCLPWASQERPVGLAGSKMLKVQENSKREFEKCIYFSESHKHENKPRIYRSSSNLIQHSIHILFVFCDESDKDLLSLRPDAMIRPSHVHCLKLARFHGCSSTERRSMRRNMKTSPWVRWPAGWLRQLRKASNEDLRSPKDPVLRRVTEVYFPSQVTATWEFLARGLGSGRTSYAKKHGVALQSSGFGHQAWLMHRCEACRAFNPWVRAAFQKHSKPRVSTFSS